MIGPYDHNIYNPDAFQAKQYAKTLPLPKPGKPKWDHQLKPLPNVTPTKESTILQEEVLRQRLKTHMEHKRILEELHKLWGIFMICVFLVHERMKIMLSLVMSEADWSACD